MNRLIRVFLACFFLLFPVILSGQNSYLDKTVNLQVGQIKLKAALKILSGQTGCVFSYDAVKIKDNQEITIIKSDNLSLRTTLQDLLPKDIHYMLMEKYIVLHLVPKEKLTYSLLTPRPISVMQPAGNIHPAETPHPDTLALFLHAADTLKNVQPKSKAIFESELAGNNHLATMSAHIGRHHIYSIVSMGYDYHGSYHLGIGAGYNLKIAKHIGANIDLIQYALVAGKSIQYDTRAYTTQFCPTLYYSIGQRLNIFAGPGVYLIKSKLVTENKVTDLGQYIGYNATLGIRIDLKNILKRKVKL